MPFGTNKHPGCIQSDTIFFVDKYLIRTYVKNSAFRIVASPKRQLFLTRGVGASNVEAYRREVL